MRNKHERRRALKLCAGLALVSFALLGAAARTVVVEPLSTLFRISRTVLQLAWQAASEAVMSATVLGRVIVRAVLLGQNGLGLLMLVAFLIAISVLPFLLVKYHRAQTIE
jgi:hypothetical protein